jgi:tetratricopeptide (TPR) repeat protein
LAAKSKAAAKSTKTSQNSLHKLREKKRGAKKQRSVQVKSAGNVRGSVPRTPANRAKKTRAAALLRRQLLLRRVPAPAPPKKPPSPGTLAAVRAFEAALKLFNRHDFGGAKQHFETVLSKFADEAEVTARAKTYLAICEQRLARASKVPRNADALYDQGVFELNRGITRDAIALFEKALKVDPRADHVLYSLAAAYARIAEPGKALDALRRAIAIRPVHKSHARRDTDLLVLKTYEGFQQLIGYDFNLSEE